MPKRKAKSFWEKICDSPIQRFEELQDLFPQLSTQGAPSGVNTVFPSAEASSDGSSSRRVWKAPSAGPNRSISTSVALPIHPAPEDVTEVPGEDVEADGGKKGPFKSEETWNKAFDALKEDPATSSLVASYLRALVEELRTQNIIGSNAVDGDVVAELGDPARRQEKLARLVEALKTKFDQRVALASRVPEYASLVLPFRAEAAVEGATHNMPAALPWVGACLGLEILSRRRPTTANFNGIKHTIANMSRYCSWTQPRISESLPQNDEELRQLECRIITLYQAVLLFQIKSVCSYHDSKRISSGPIIAGFLAAEVQAIKAAEEALKQDMPHQSGNGTAESVISQTTARSESVEDLLKDIGEHITSIRSKQNSEEHDKLLKALFVVDPHEDMIRIQNNKDELLPDASDWILNTEEYAAFTDWSGDDGLGQKNCRVFWIKGHAGTGKTMLLMGIIQELLKKPANLNPIPSVFFCQATDSVLNRAVSVLRCILWQLLQQQPHLLPHLEAALKHKDATHLQGEYAMIILTGVFKSILAGAELKQVYLIVDALDECEQDLSGLVDLIYDSLRLSKHVRWLVSSRPSVDLRPPPSSGSMVELDSQRLEGPVKAYIDHKLLVLKDRDGYDEKIMSEIRLKVCERADNTFLWASLVFKELDAKDGLDFVRGEDALEIIEEMPSGLASLYEHMMIRIERRKRREPRYCKSVLIAAVLAYRPLSLSELKKSVDVPESMVPKIVTYCGSFLTMKGNIIYLIHQSAKDYLDANYTQKLQQSGLIQGHADMGMRCLTAMSSVLKQNIYGLPYGIFLKDLVVDKDPLSPAKYSCLFWVTHFCRAFDKSIQFSQSHEKAVWDFLSTHFLHWLEALAFMGKLSNSITSIDMLADTKFAVDGPILDFLKDAKRFTLFFFSMISTAPLQVYASGLVFAPLESIVRQTFEKARPKWIEEAPAVDLSWSYHLLTLHQSEREFACALAYSRDGSLLASLTWSGTVMIWRANTGEYLHTLSSEEITSPFGNGCHCPLSFSKDGDQLAVAYERTSKLWSTKTGKCLQTYQPNGWKKSFASFLIDGTLLEAMVGRFSVEVWNRTANERFCQLQSPEKIKSVAISADGSLIAIFSSTGIIQLWNTRTAEIALTLEKFESNTVEVGFLGVGQWLVVKAPFKSSVWNTETGECVHEVGSEFGSKPRFYTLCGDGGKVALSDGHDLTVIDLTTKKSVGPFHLKWPPIVLALSLETNRLAVGGIRFSIHIVDVDLLFHSAEKPPRSRVECMTFSPERDRLVTRQTDENTITVWNLENGQRLRDITAPQPIIKAYISRAGRLATVSQSGVVYVWNLAVCDEPDILETGTENIDSLQFLSEDRLISIKGSSEEKVCLWDIANKSRLASIEGYFVIQWLPDCRLFLLRKKINRGDYKYTVYDSETGKSVSELSGLSETGYVIAAFAKDGSRLALRYESTFDIWDPRTGKCLGRINNWNEQYEPLLLSDNGDKLAIFTKSDAVRIMDITAFKSCTRYQPEMPLIAAGFLGDGSGLALEFSDGSCGLLNNKGTLKDFAFVKEALLRHFPQSSARNSKKGFGLRYEGKSWITYQGDRLLYLPPDYEPFHIYIRGSMVMLFTTMGRLIFRFNSDKLKGAIS